MVTHQPINFINTIHLKVLSKRGEERIFNARVYKIDVSFNLLCDVVAVGITLLDAYLCISAKVVQRHFR